MSGNDYLSYRRETERSKDLVSDDSETRRRSEEARKIRMRGATAKAAHEAPREHAKPLAVSAEPIIASLANNVIGVPPKEVEEVHIALIDNSGSNAKIATGMRDRASYMRALFDSLAGNAGFATVFFSDHCDGPRGLFQDVGYTTPGTDGDKVLRASIAQVRSSGGGDAPEAIECALKRAAEFDFGHVPKERRYLYLVSDQVAHGMGYNPRDDDGCPNQVHWRHSVEQVHQTFASFQVIASGEDSRIFNLQKQFIAEERWRYDLMDFATGQLTHDERCGLVANGLVFLVARNRGAQTVNLFLQTLAEKWLAEPMYGSNTLPRARRQIGDFANYLEITDQERGELMAKIFPEL
jgi:hypothetical protein